MLEAVDSVLFVDVSAASQTFKTVSFKSLAKLLRTTPEVVSVSSQ